MKYRYEPNVVKLLFQAELQRHNAKESKSFYFLLLFMFNGVDQFSSLVSIVYSIA